MSQLLSGVSSQLTPNGIFMALLCDAGAVRQFLIERAKEGPLKRFEAMPAPASQKRRDTARTECLAHFGGQDLSRMGGVRLQDKPEVIARMLSEGSFLQENAKIHWDKRSDSFHFIYTFVQAAKRKAPA